MITGKDLDVWYRAGGGKRARARGRGGKAQTTESRGISRVGSTKCSTPDLPVDTGMVTTPPTAPVPPVQNVQTVHSAPQPLIESPIDGDQPTPPLMKELERPPLLTREPLTDDRFITPAEALTALREIGVLVGRGLGSSLDVEVARIGSSTMDGVDDIEHSVLVEPLSSIEDMIVEVVEGTTTTAPEQEYEILPAQHQTSTSDIDEEIPFSTLETEGFLDEIQPSEVVSVEDDDLAQVIHEPSQVQPLSCTDTVGEVCQLLDPIGKEVQASIEEIKTTVDNKKGMIDPLETDLVAVQILAQDQSNAIPVQTTETVKKDNRASRRPKKVSKPKLPTPLPIIDRTTHKSARGMTKNERRLHQSLLAKFDGRGIAS